MRYGTVGRENPAIAFDLHASPTAARVTCFRLKVFIFAIDLC